MTDNNIKLTIIVVIAIYILLLIIGGHYTATHAEKDYDSERTEYRINRNSETKKTSKVKDDNNQYRLDITDR